MSEKISLFHFFPRNCHSAPEALAVLDSIINNGILLTYEHLKIPGQETSVVKTQILEIEQYRFCLTALTHQIDILNHCKTFGCIGLEFDMDFIIGLGGFPVFYFPSPNLSHSDLILGKHTGISLLNRLSELQEIIEFIINNGINIRNDIDLKNVLGAIKFLGNICYPTSNLSETNISNVYYKQNEWRIIYNAKPDDDVISFETSFKSKRAYCISYFKKKPISFYIKRIVLLNRKNQKSNSSFVLKRKQITQILKKNNLNIEIQII